MLFSSLIFLSIFLPLTMFLYFIVKKSLKNYILLIASLIFYGWGEPKYLGLMLIVILLNYLFAILIDKNIYKRLNLLIAVIINLSILIYFKYFNFIILNFNKVFEKNIEITNIIMPIGISFFIFQSMSYVIDVYHGEVKIQKNIYNLALYISLFPQLIAGPIVKYHEIQLQIENRQENINNIFLGLKRFSFGLGKKVLLANTLGEVSDTIFNSSFNIIDLKIAWLGAICYSLQLYFDFSGYSDMAIGLGKIFGFHFLENFDYPYISKSITEFWRRWHISLGSWFREYLYIPLGGNKINKTRTYINLFIVFLVTGIWHGANWTFILWGIWHGIFIILERIINIEKYKDTKFIVLRHIYTVIIFIVGWVLFRADTLSYAYNYIKLMFGLEKNLKIGYTLFYYMNNKVILTLVVSILASISSFKFIAENNNKISNILSILILILSIISISAATYNPFIYFRF